MSVRIAHSSRLGMREHLKGIIEVWHCDSGKGEFKVIIFFQPTGNLHNCISFLKLKTIMNIRCSVIQTVLLLS
jgi:hypothetical protein